MNTRRVRRKESHAQADMRALIGGLHAKLSSSWRVTKVIVGCALTLEVVKPAQAPDATTCRAQSIPNITDGKQ